MNRTKWSQGTKGPIMPYIPQMTNPFSKHWKQPDLSEIELHPNFARMTAATMSKLAFYNTTIPTGVYEGKMFGRSEDGKDYLVWFGVSDNPEQCSINSLVIDVI